MSEYEWLLFALSVCKGFTYGMLVLYLGPRILRQLEME